MRATVKTLAVFAALASVALGNETLLRLPIGDAGIHYEGVGIAEALPWGPSALELGPDGTFWIADAAANRILCYDGSGTLLRSLDLAGIVVGIGDIAVTPSDVIALDIAAQDPKVVRMSWQGQLLESHLVPSELGPEHGLSGIALGDSGELLLEIEGGARLVQLLDVAGTLQVTATQRLVDGVPYRAVPGDMTGPQPARGYVDAGSIRIGVAVDKGALGGLTVLGVTPVRDVYAILEEVALIDGRIAVDQTVRRYDATGRLRGAARTPAQLTYVAHPLALEPESGAVYALVTMDDRVEIQRLGFSPRLPAALQGASPVVAAAPGADATNCVTRDAMYSKAGSIRNNWKYLNGTNTDGYCSGRGKPRYIGGAGSYKSVAYDWGGWDDATLYNGYVDPNTYKAGDINTAAVESCSRGTDCSGFVSRCWALGSKYSTSMIPNISTQLGSTSSLLKGDVMNKAGSHVVLFTSFGTNGIYDYEATTYNSYDRAVWIFSSWSRLSGYVPRRYNGVCN